MSELAYPILRRRCACGGTPGPDGECAACKAKRLERQARGDAPAQAPPIVHDVLRSAGRPLEPGVRARMEGRFGHDFSRVRIHTDERAAQSARAVDAHAYAVGASVVFDDGRYQPSTSEGGRLLAHELAHVVQQRHAGPVPNRLEVGASETASEREAERASAASGTRLSSTTAPLVQRVRGPYIKRVTVHLKPSQNAELTWEGTPPSGAPGKDAFKVSTGKGYGDPDDPRGTCKRECCTDPDTQCAPPWNRPDKVGACCTYIGDDFWTGTPEDEHGGPGGWKFWTPIQPWYSKRHIALHQHHEVTGKPIGHGCVRMEEANAERIARYSRGRATRVVIDGRAAPVLCDASRRCGARAGLEQQEEDTRLAAAEPVPGLEGEMS